MGPDHGGLQDRASSQNIQRPINQMFYCCSYRSKLGMHRERYYRSQDGCWRWCVYFLSRGCALLMIMYEMAPQNVRKADLFQVVGFLYLLRSSFCSLNISSDFHFSILHFQIWRQSPFVNALVILMIRVQVLDCAFSDPTTVRTSEDPQRAGIAYFNFFQIHDLSNFEALHTLATGMAWNSHELWFNYCMV